ncbi:MAG TPA: SUMF1/EgtB/PvdO family nonheme iron enzyme [Cyclobacteriaceae bacterium]
MSRIIRVIFIVLLSLMVFVWLWKSGDQKIETPPGMVFIPGNDAMDSFFMDATPVTVAQFREFVNATGYITQAEKFGDAGVFTIEENWHLVKGANWEFAMGREEPKAKDSHPVTQISYYDALAYSEWAGKRLPTEKEWQHAAMDGEHLDTQYNWGNRLVVEGRFMANTWQGSFPFYNSNEDGFATTSPVGTFGKTKLGLTDISGNVWEWCSDWKISPGLSMVNFEPDSTTEKVLRGGSFLCDLSYCQGYRLDGRSGSTPQTSLFHTGFRCVKDIN